MSANFAKKEKKRIDSELCRVTFDNPFEYLQLQSVKLHVRLIIFQFCTCCKATGTTWKKVNLNCGPGVNPVVSVESVTGCACTHCS